MGVYCRAPWEQAGGQQRDELWSPWHQYWPWRRLLQRRPPWQCRWFHLGGPPNPVVSWQHCRWRRYPWRRCCILAQKSRAGTSCWAMKKESAAPRKLSFLAEHGSGLGGQRQCTHPSGKQQLIHATGSLAASRPRVLLEVHLQRLRLGSLAAVGVHLHSYGHI